MVTPAFHKGWKEQRKLGMIQFLVLIWSMKEQESMGAVNAAWGRSRIMQLWFSSGAHWAVHGILRVLFLSSADVFG